LVDCAEIVSVPKQPSPLVNHSLSHSYQSKRYIHIA
jgi:hypothetical protein